VLDTVKPIKYYKLPLLFSINDHGYCAENILDTMVARSIDVDVVDECGRLYYHIIVNV